LSRTLVPAIGKQAELTGVLLSIKTKYVKEIPKRKKHYEFRKADPEKQIGKNDLQYTGKG
jgi:hypothetical protein